MKNKKLVDINFKELVNYGGMPEIKYEYETPLRCEGFCVSCEKHGFLNNDKKIVLDQMSHGADTWDFEQLLGKLPTPYRDISVVFLLESPGGYYDNGKQLKYKGITKQPPVKVYYWMPPGATWPTNPYTLANKYGPYFAYLLHKFRLKNSYITNIIKCSLAIKDDNRFEPYNVIWNEDNRDTKIRKNCYNLFLSRELEIQAPQVVFCFGVKAEKMMHYLKFESKYLHIKTLYHPAARISRKALIEENNKAIEEVLRSIKMPNKSLKRDAAKSRRAP